MFFHGVEGCGKKTIVHTTINHLIMKHYNLQPEDVEMQKKNYTYQNNKKEENLVYYKNPYYIHVDLAKLGKKKYVLLTNVLDHFIIKTRNIHNRPFNLIIFSNFDILDDKFALKFHNYMDKYTTITRFICITNKTSITRHPKITNFVNIRIPRLTKDELLMITKFMLNRYHPNIKTTTAIFKKNFEKIIGYSKRNLAKTIFYTQLLYEYGQIQLKYIAMRGEKTMDYLFGLITSNDMKNIQDMNKLKNTTQIRPYNTLKLRELVYQCVMSIDNYEVFIRTFYTYLLTKQPIFMKKYNTIINKLIGDISDSCTTTNKTTFILAECFFLKLMAVYALDQHGVNINTI
jgi:DNA polymerase III delta prime subunit